MARRKQPRKVSLGGAGLAEQPAAEAEPGTGAQTPNTVTWLAFDKATFDYVSELTIGRP